MKRFCRSLISKDNFIIIHFLAAFIMSENSGKSRHSPSCHLTAPPAGQHTLGRQSHTAPPSCPTRRNLQGATPGKCVSLKFRCCFISLPPVANPVGTNLCLEPSQAQCNLHRGASSHEMGSCHPFRFAKALRIKAKIKSDVCVSYSIVLGSFKPKKILRQ